MSKEYKITDKPYAAEKPDYLRKKVPVKSKFTGKEGYVIAKSYDCGKRWYISKRQFKQVEMSLCGDGDCLVITNSDIDEILVETKDYLGFCCWAIITKGGTI